MIKLARLAAKVLVIDAVAFLVGVIPLTIILESIRDKDIEAIMLTLAWLVIASAFLALATLLMLGALVLIKRIDKLG